MSAFITEFNQRVTKWIDESGKSIPYLSTHNTLCLSDNYIEIKTVDKTNTRVSDTFKKSVEYINSLSKIDIDGIFDTKVVEFLRLMGLAEFKASKEKSQVPFIVKATSKCIHSIRLLSDDTKDYICSFLTGPESQFIVTKRKSAANVSLRLHKDPTEIVTYLFKVDFCSELLKTAHIRLLDFCKLKYSSLTNEQLKLVCESCPKLEVLNIDKCRDITQLPPTSSVSILNISRTGISDLSPLQNWTSLRELYIRDCSKLSILPEKLHVGKLLLSKSSIKEFRPLTTWTQIHTLIIARPKECLDIFPQKLNTLKKFVLIKGVVANVDAFATWTKLEELILKSGFIPIALPDNLSVRVCSLIRFDHADLTPISTWKNLQTLNLTSCYNLRSLPQNSDVKTLSLCSIKPLRSLSNLTSWPKLKQLQVVNCPNISRFPNRLTVEELEIKDTSILDFTPLKKWSLTSFMCNDVEHLSHLK